MNLRQAEYFESHELEISDTVLRLINNHAREGKIKLGYRPVSSLLH